MKEIKEVIDILKPDGGQLSIDALFDIAHVNTKEPSANIGKHRTVLLSIKNADKNTVPIGSIVYVSESTKQALTRE